MINEDDYLRLREVAIVDGTDPNIDDHLINLPMQQIEINEFAAVALSAKDTAKFDYEQAVADTAVKIRTQDTGKQPSEAQIKSELPLWDEVAAATHALIIAEYDYNLWKGLADAIRTKSSSLRAFAELMTAGYMTQDTIRNNRREEIHDQRIRYQQQSR